MVGGEVVGFILFLLAAGIVVGRLHNDDIWGWNRGNRLRQKIVFDELLGE